jgi:hypothetical protein
MGSKSDAWKIFPDIRFMFMSYRFELKNRGLTARTVFFVRGPLSVVKNGITVNAEGI